MRVRNPIRISLGISLVIHVTVLAFPSLNLPSFTRFKRNKLIEVSLVNIAPSFPAELIKVKESAREEPVPSETIHSEPVSGFSEGNDDKLKKTKNAREYATLIPEPTCVPEERSVDFRGYSREAVKAIFKRYGLKYKKYNPGLGRAQKDSPVRTFTFEGKQLGNSRKDSQISFNGKPRLGSMVLVIPPQIYLELLEVEREELRKRRLPLTTPLERVVFGIGKDEHGQYVLAVRELVLKK